MMTPQEMEQGLSDVSATPLVTREVRLDVDGAPWSNQRDPSMRERIIGVYRELCATGETGRQLVAVHQEICADLEALTQAVVALGPRLDRIAAAVASPDQNHPVLPNFAKASNLPP